MPGAIGKVFAGLALGAVLFGCSDQEPEAREGRLDPALIDHPAVVPVEAIPPRPEAVGAPPPRRLVFLNRHGGLYQPGDAYDASKNTAPLLDEPATLPAYEGSDADWQAVLGCVRDLYGAFNVDVVDREPEAAPYLEVVVGGEPGDAGFTDYGGIAPINGDCSVVERGVGFVFSKSYSGRRSECEVVAHELGHMTGLDHAFFCPDPMSYLGGCGDKRFQDRDVSCGEDEVRPCMCSGTQNSVQDLLTRLGPATGPGGEVFSDIRYSVFRDSIVWIHEQGITKGCGGGRYCPERPVTRGQMAAFLSRALDLPAAPSAGFSDTEGHLFETAADRLFAAGITTGCGGDRFCPDHRVTRGQMAAFLQRALEE